MAVDVVTLSLAKKYTKDTAQGAGAVAGKPCQIQSIDPITGGNRVTFLWLDNAGTSHTSTMDVIDGVDGQDGADGARGPKGNKGDTGLGIKSVEVNDQGHLIVTYDDDTTQDAGEIQVTAAVDSVNGKTGEVELTASDVGALPDDTTIPSKISDLTNDSDFIEKSATEGLIKNDGTIDTKTYVEVEAGKGLSTNDYDATAKTAVDALKSASTKDTTTFISPGNHDIPDADATYKAMTSMLEGAFHPTGNKTIAELTSALLIQANVGNVYKITDNGTTDANWVGGAGQTIAAGQMAVVVYGNAAGTFLFNLENGINIDLSAYQTKLLSAPITVDGTEKTNVEDTLAAINTLAAANKTAVGNIKDGQSIDSFSDVETALDNKVDWKSNGVLGAKNLIPYPYYQASPKETNGITFTYTDDGIINANGTATADALFAITYNIELNDFDKCILSGCPEGGGDATYHIYVCQTVNPYTHYANDYGNGAVINCPSSQNGQIVIRIRSGVRVDNLKFKPMIRLASDPDDTYVPYAKTNQQLTYGGPIITNHLIVWNEDLNLGTSKGAQLYQYGKLYFVTYWFKATTALTGNTPILKLPKKNLIIGNYVITEDNDTAVWGGRAIKDNEDYVSISCPIVVDKTYRCQCVCIDVS